MHKGGSTGARRGAYTLIEMMIAITCAALLSLTIYTLLIAGLQLFRKNGAVNANHEQVRKVTDRLEREIQSAISIPALVDMNREVVDTTGPAPGIAFLRQSGPLRRVAATASAGSTTVQLDSGPAPLVGQRLLIPAYDIEGDITAVTGNSVTLATPLSTELKITSGSLDRNIIAVVTDLVSYVVVNNDLREYQNASSNKYNTVITGITSPAPFSLPFNAVPSASPTP